MTARPAIWPRGRGSWITRSTSPCCSSSGFDGTVVLHQMHHLSEAEIDSRFAYVSQQAPAGFLE